MIPSCEYSERPIHAHAHVSDDGEGGMFFQRDARQRLGLCRTVVPAVVASAVALVRAPRFVDPFDRALAGLARRPRGRAVVAARASPRPSDPRETPFSRGARSHGHRRDDLCFSVSARAPADVSPTNTPADFSSLPDPVVFPTTTVVRFTTSASARRSRARRSARSTRGTSSRSWAATTSRASA